MIHSATQLVCMSLGSYSFGLTGDVRNCAVCEMRLLTYLALFALLFQCSNLQMRAIENLFNILTFLNVLWLVDGVSIYQTPFMVSSKWLDICEKFLVECNCSLNTTALIVGTDCLASQHLKLPFYLLLGLVMNRTLTG